MKKTFILYLFSLISFAFISCGKNKEATNTTAYIFEISGYTYSYTPFGTKVEIPCKLEFKEEKVFSNEKEDSILLSIVKDNINKNKDYLNKYFDEETLRDNDNTIKGDFKLESKRAALRALIGRKVFFVTVSDSIYDIIKNKPVIECISDYYKHGASDYAKFIRSTLIYDGDNINADLTIGMEEEHVRRVYGLY